MRVNLDSYIFIDNHAHSLLRGHLLSDAIAFRQSFSESRSMTVLKEHLPASAFYIDMVAMLSKLLGVSGEDGILEYRARQSERSYLNLLWDEASIGALIVDDGYRSAEMIDLTHLGRMSGRPVYRCARVETVLEKCIKQSASFTELVSSLRKRLFDSTGPRTVALKTIVAYRGGLELSPVGADEARMDFDRRIAALQAEECVRITRCALYDYLLLKSFEWAAEEGVPVQIHSGIGDDDADLRLSNPLGFREILKGQSFSKTNFVFLHCYPFVRESAYLCAIYPNVYMDLSLAMTLVSPSADMILNDAISAAPSSKILAGTDGHNIPESHWYGVTCWKRSLAEVLDALIASRYLDLKQAQDMAARILHENARILYGLDDLA